jgi:ADP-dependent NAD(P)H-hydrate dehydratase / NAD(P)H-hydrate epimerase
LPTPLYTAAQVRELDRLTIEVHEIPGIILMRRAAKATVAAIRHQWPDIRRVTVFCGSGNNAGDGYIIAGLLAESGIAVLVVVVGDPDKLGEDATAALNYCKNTAARFADNNEFTKTGIFDPLGSDLMVDALLGTGMSGGLRPAYARAIGELNSSKKPIVAVDVPSGLSADDGSVNDDAIQADLTVTFIGRKRGLYTGEGPQRCGRIVYADLGVPQAIFAEVHSNTTTLELDECRQQLPVRRREAHKTDFGHLLIVGGAPGMGGAVIMAAEAALRVGAGLVTVATHQQNTIPLLSRRPEVMARGVSCDADLDPLLEKASCVVLGPGLGNSDWSAWLFGRLVDCGKPGVLDADGLNLLALQTASQRQNWVLTPHPGEATRLLGGRFTDRFEAVEQIQRTYGGVVLLKGAGTLIADGQSISLCPYGNPGMATAGMGDVLSGVIGGLLAQGMSARDAAATGAVLHAHAGDLIASKHGGRGLVATDVIPVIRELVG